MNWSFFLRKMFLPFLLLCSLVAVAQTRTISGRVTDAAGLGIPGVTIAARGGTVATVTNENGEFNVTVPATTTVLVFSSVGYAPREVTLAEGSSTLVVALSRTEGALSEVVVVGYGTQRRRDVTGAVSTVTSKEFVRGPIISPEQLIAGKVAGVQITPNSGLPGSGSRIRVRAGTSLNASNDPLLVVDGVPLDNTGIAGAPNPLSMINPNDIESFTILKDASAAAIYGSRAANGVIIITTKRGTSGKVRVNFNSQNFISQRTGRVDVLNADEFRSMVQQRGSASDIAMLGTANTDWQNEIFRTAFGSDNAISISGGIPNLPYRFSAGYLNQNGILQRSNLSRTTFGLNLSPQLLNNHLGVNANAKFSHAKNFFANEGAIGAAVFFDPTKPVRSDKTEYGGFWEWTNNGGLVGLAPKNPVGLLNQREDQSTVNRFIGNVQFDYRFHFLPELRANLNLGMDRSDGSGTVFVPAHAASDTVRGGINNQYRQEKTNKLLEYYMNYASDITSIRSRLDVMAGYSWQDWMTQSPAFDDRSATGLIVTPAGMPFETQNTLVSFFGRLNYSLMERYFLTFTMRRDGSSRFSPNTRWGNFPSAAFAWNLKEETFLRDSRALSNFKIRFGWGVTGQQDIGLDYGYQPNIFYGDSAAQYQFGGAYVPVARPAAYDENLKWEETESRNIGLDFGFANNRINFTADYFIRDTRDLLAVVPAPAGTNFSNLIMTNVGNMRSRGFEFGVDVNAVRTNDFNLNFNYNITHIIQNDITRLQLTNDPTYLGAEVGGTGFNNVQIHSVGYRPNTFFLYKQVYDRSGNPIEGLYEDRNRDGKIDDFDKYWVHNPEPRVFMGFSTNANYKKLGAGFALRANFGNYMYNALRANAGVFQNVSTGNNFLVNAHRDILTTGFDRRQVWSDHYLENASFLRMDNMYVNYDFGRVSRNLNLRASFNVQNVFVITNYTGLDPELSGGIDGTVYPRPRMYSLGFNLEF